MTDAETENFVASEYLNHSRCAADNHVRRVRHSANVDLGYCFHGNGLANLVDELEHNPRIIRFKGNPDILKKL